jgi:hypothetical protein
MEWLRRRKATDRRECERRRRQRTIYQYLRDIDGLVAKVIPIRLSDGITSLVFYIPSPCWPVSSIRRLSHTQITSPNIFSIAFSDCHFLSIIIAPHLWSPPAAFLCLSTGVNIDVDRRLRCGSGWIGVLFYIHHCFKKRDPLQACDVI